MGGYLITGATGFVGSHLIEAVARNGLRTRALVRRTSDLAVLERHGVERVVGDLSDSAGLREAVADADTVLHLAAATRALRPGAFHAVNAEGTRRLVRAMEEDGRPRRLIYLSSLAAVGPRAEMPAGPEDEPHPVTAYGRSKLEGERAALSSARLSVAVLRAPAVYGPGDRDLLTFFKLADRGVLPLVGSPERRLQFVHVRDLVEGVLAAAGAEATGIFHIAEPRGYAWSEVLDLLRAAVGRRAVRIPVPSGLLRGAAAVAEAVARARGKAGIFDRDKAREVLAPGWLCETDRARRELGYEAAVPLEEGLRETAAWYRSYHWLRPVRA
ncbi:MAG TPA: NAD-dependent epimerase/dehydratase family protein [Longimicrobiales bacterium]|nr:NAD-dependent epimerase/dehydratase family protein [Longimicrobiales bacterium]